MSALKRKEDGLHHVAHIDKRDVLTAEAHGKIGVTFYRLRHQEIVALARSVDTRGPQRDAGQPVGQRVEIVLCVQFAPAVCRVGLRRVTLANLLVGLFLAYGSEDAERTQVDHALQRHVHSQQGIGQMARALGVDAAEIVLVKALRHACRMNNVVEPHAGLTQLVGEPLRRTQVEFYETDAAVTQPLARTALPDGCPHLHVASQSLLHDETADEPACAGDEDFFHNSDAKVINNS